MKVAVLQQYLRSLLEPMRASGASAKIITDLERTCECFEPFGDRDTSDLADFLRRAKEYEEQGHWPAAAAGKKAAGKGKPQLGAQDIQDLATRLLRLRGTPALDGELKAVEGLTVPQLKDLYRHLGISGSFKAKADGLTKARTFLTAPATSRAPAASDKMGRIVETLLALKGKADAPQAPFEEIEAELQSLETQLDAREAIQAAKALGVVRTVTTRDEALQAIRRKVLQVKYAQEVIAY